MLQSRLASLSKSQRISVFAAFSIISVIVLFFIWTLAEEPVMGFWFRLTNASEAATKWEIRRTVSAVSKLIVLPNGDPTIATVTDKTKLAGQAFFAKAENGDKVLIYTEAKKAYLYRPNNHLIVEVAPLNVTDPAAATQGTTPSTATTPANDQVTTTPSPTISRPVSVALYNGTTTAGLTAQYETKVAASMKDAVIKVKQNAAKSSYATSIVVDISGQNAAAAKDLAAALGFSVGTLPAGETKPASDLLVVLGKDSATP